jgi:catechol 2,3-dioxygenase-like lactoylglutathione lyase family enzyme
MAITGAHLLLYTPEADAARAILRDVLGWRYIEDNGWPIYNLPPAEVAIHPSDGSTSHELSLMCDDIQATVADLRAQGVEFDGEPEDIGHGPMITMVLPGDLRVLLYEPHHPTAI